MEQPRKLVDEEQDHKLVEKEQHRRRVEEHSAPELRDVPFFCVSSPLPPDPSQCRRRPQSMRAKPRQTVFLKSKNKREEAGKRSQQKNIRRKFIFKKKDNADNTPTTHT